MRTTLAPALLVVAIVAALASLLQRAPGPASSPVISAGKPHGTEADDPASPPTVLPAGPGAAGGGQAFLLYVDQNGLPDDLYGGQAHRRVGGKTKRPDPFRAGSPSEARIDRLRQIVREGLRRDPVLTTTWIAGLHEPVERLAAGNEAIAHAARFGPAHALELAEILQVDPADGSLERMAQLWTEEDPEEAVDWVLTRPASPLRDRLAARIAYVRANRAPDEAWLLVEILPAGAARDEARRAVLRQAIARDLVE